MNRKISKLLNDNKKLNNDNEKLNGKISKISNDNLYLNEQFNKLNNKMDQITVILDCPISLVRMSESVKTPDGNTYDNKSIRDWINNHNNTEKSKCA